MSTDIVPANGTAHEMDREQMDLVKRNYAPEADDNEFALYLSICDGLGLDPRAKQVYLISRYSKAHGRKIASIQLGIDGLRLIAQRSGHYAGTDAPLWCGADGQWTDIWLDEKQPPAGCKVGVWRAGATRPTVGVVLYREFKQETPFWRDMPANQLAIRAEAKALRMAFQADIQAAEATFADAKIELPEPEPAPRVSVDEPARPAPEVRQLAAPALRTQASSGTEAAATASTAARAPMSAPGGGDAAPQQPAALTGFFQTCADGCGLDRAGVRRVLQVADASWSDEVAIRNALAQRDLPNSRRGLGELATTVATLHAAAQGKAGNRQAVPDAVQATVEAISEDALDRREGTLDGLAGEAASEMTDAVRHLRSDVDEPVEAF